MEGVEMPSSDDRGDDDRVRTASDQTAADADQTSSDSDQTSSDRDQAAAEGDQAASDRDQAVADREFESFADDDLARRDHEESKAERARGTRETDGGRGGAPGGGD